MRRETIPLIVLGGRDHRLEEQEDQCRGRRPLEGYKGVELRIHGRPLVEILIERMTATGVFGPVLIAGPREIYEPLFPEIEIVDTDGTFGQNLRRSVEHVRQTLKTEMVAITTCDILPDPDELETALADLKVHQPLDFWMPQIRVPEDAADLGASEWKPKYRLVPAGGGRSVPILPGHLLVCNPEAVRLRFVYHFFDLLYRTRNRPLAYRRLVLTRNLLWNLVVEDIKHVLSLRLPHIFFPVVYDSLVLAARLKAGTASVTEAEDRIRRAFLKSAHRKKYPNRRGRVLLSPALSLAKDIDTEEEARELERRTG